MRRVFENSVKAAHSTSIARPCDGGVSELFRSCFFALAMFSRRWRENIASVPAGLLALRAQNARPPGSLRSPSELRPGRLIGPVGQTHGLQVRFAPPPKCALTRFARQRRANPASVPAGLFSPFGLKTHGLQVRWRGPSELRPARAWPARGFRTASRPAPVGRGFLSGADVENRPKRGILKLM